MPRFGFPSFLLSSSLKKFSFNHLRFLSAFLKGGVALGVFLVSLTGGQACALFQEEEEKSSKQEKVHPLTAPEKEAAFFVGDRLYNPDGTPNPEKILIEVWGYFGRYWNHQNLYQLVQLNKNFRGLVKSQLQKSYRERIQEKLPEWVQEKFLRPIQQKDLKELKPV